MEADDLGAFSHHRSVGPSEYLGFNVPYGPSRISYPGKLLSTCRGLPWPEATWPSLVLNFGAPGAFTPHTEELKKWLTKTRSMMQKRPRRPVAVGAVPCLPAAGQFLDNPLVKVGLVVISIAAAAAVAAAAVGPRRLQREVYDPLQGAFEPHAEKLKAEAAELRDRISELLEKAGPERRRMARRLQSFIGHFRAD